MSELNQISDVKQIVNNIKEEITHSEPSSTRIINFLCDLRYLQTKKTKKADQSLSDKEFYDIVGETFKLNPEFFMEKLYKPFRSKMGKLIGDEKLKEMEKYIIENFCLYEGEQILQEFNGEIKQMKSKSTVRASVGGRIYVTNYRIIAHGKLSSSGGQFLGSGFEALLFLPITALTGHSKRTRSKLELLKSSTYQQLPCYGYQFQAPIGYGARLKRKSTNITYGIIPNKILLEKLTNSPEGEQQKMLKNSVRIIKITVPRIHIDRFIEIFSKKISANQILYTFRDLHEMGLNQEIKGSEFLYRLQSLRTSEAYQHLTDSEYLDIVIAIYKLDPEFFMTSIYPKMRSWDFPSFLSVKEELFELLNKEGVDIK